MNKQQIKAGISAAVIGVLSPLAMALPASAVTKTWNGGTDSLFNENTNWDGGTQAGSTDDAVFPASALNQNVDVNAAGLELQKIVFSGAVSGTSSKSYTITSSLAEAYAKILISSGIDAIMTGSGGDHSVETGIDLTGNAVFKTSGSNTLSVGAEGKTLNLGSHELTLDASGGTITILGKIGGTGKIIKSGNGKVKLMATPDTGYAGSIEVALGEFNVSTSSFGSGNVTISGGTLKGSGTIGDITMSSGSIAPGNSPGCINSGDLVLTGGSYDVELAGKSATSCEYDNLTVTGGVNLGSATTLNVSLINSFAPAVNDSFSIILNDGTDAVQGTFKGLDDGDKFTLGSYTYQINYDAGDGNDVVLLVTGTPSAPDTGTGSLLTNPWVTLVAAITVAGSVAGYRYYEVKKVRR